MEGIVGMSPFFLALLVSLLLESGMQERAGPAWAEDVIRTYPEGHVLVIKKDQRRMALGKDGKPIHQIKVKKSELDRQFFGFLEGTPDDEVELRFPVPCAVSDRPGTRTYRYDKKTPEGTYRVCQRNGRNDTRNTVALSIGFPNAEDLRAAWKRRRISKQELQDELSRLKRGYCPSYETYLGGWIRIHGPSDKQTRKWRREGVRSCENDPPTDDACRRLSWDEYLRADDADIGVVIPGRHSMGCMVLELTPLFYLYQVIEVGTPVVILP
jgi:hypothetical protein